MICRDLYTCNALKGRCAFYDCYTRLVNTKRTVWCDRMCHVCTYAVCHPGNKCSKCLLICQFFIKVCLITPFQIVSLCRSAQLFPCMYMYLSMFLEAYFCQHLNISKNSKKIVMWSNWMHLSNVES